MNQAARACGARLFTELDLVDRYARMLRSSSKWSERTHAAQVLGLAGATGAIPALVEALRDRHEDESSVKAEAAATLAKLRVHALRQPGNKLGRIRSFAGVAHFRVRRVGEVRGNSIGLGAVTAKLRHENLMDLTVS